MLVVLTGGVVFAENITSVLPPLTAKLLVGCEGHYAYQECTQCGIAGSAVNPCFPITQPFNEAACTGGRYQNPIHVLCGRCEICCKFGTFPSTWCSKYKASPDNRDNHAFCECSS